MAECLPEGPDLKDMNEEELWDLINDNRHAISIGVRPCLLIPYLRQARVLTDLDEDEILTCLKLSNRSMRTSHMLDILRTQGRNGAVALLESLMIHYPSLYTQITGRKPSTEPSGFSGLIKYSELTEYLVRAVTGMQKELQEARQEAAQLRTRCCGMEVEVAQALQQGEEQGRLQAEHAHMRNHLAGLHRDLLKLKDEKCDLYVRYASAVEERSAVDIRCRDLQLQVYQLQCELQKAQTETDFQRRRSIKHMSSSETQQLKEELAAVRRQLLEAEKFTPAKQDILAQDLEEERDGRYHLAEQLRRLTEENEQLTRERDKLLEEKECLALQVQKLSLDCKMYQQKSTVFQNQLGELQAERDRAYLSRDDAQAQIARSLAEKDTLRGQLVELQEKVFSLSALNNQQRERPQKCKEWNFSWESSKESCSYCPPTSSTPRTRLRRMDAVHPDFVRSYESEVCFSEEGLSSVRSSLVEPPGSESFRRRDIDLHFNNDRQDTTGDSSLSVLDLESDFVFIPKDEVEEVSSASLLSSTPTQKSCSSDSVCRASAPPFLVRRRPQAVRITGRVLTLSLQGEVLLSQIQIVGGNKTGVFVHQVTEGSSAHAAGISRGAQILEVKYEQERRALRMVLEDSTLEEALWALGQVRGPCHLSLRPNQDAYENLLQQLKNGEITSGDSFYVRVNMSLQGSTMDALHVTCNDILHVTNTRYGNDGSWWASHVHSCQLVDLKSGTLPNYYRAQRLLIRAIEDMTFEHRSCKKMERVQDQGKQKAVRIVSTRRQGRNPLWISVEEDSTEQAKESSDGSAPRSCVTLMPYTLVTPHYPPVCRPVLLLPTVLGRILNRKLGEQEGYHLCEPDLLSPSERAVRVQKGEVLEDSDPNTHRCYTLQGVEKIMKRGTHCVLPLGLDCVRRLHKAEIFPIIVFIASTERSVRRLKNKLRQNYLSEAQLLECYRNEEPLLDKLPCLYRTVQPDSWSDSASLVDTILTVVREEQRKIVWLEPELW
ncbi:caspase recruitment domain-containing protein 14 [Chanos chanos]|uniref:Caspase recruitment domain-containing protein 14 n=1 Tax=Chanos chanos TaxID=29144 RepID=A0A6J2W3Q5_CHACN|nr:caspase recruitment domain-containing protein 14-like [Chanos chanos]